jgi:GT2 family glycosyltransferase
MKVASLSVVILNYNGIHHLKECIESVRTSTYPLESIIVVDNGSTDGSQEMVRANFHDVILLENLRNLGIPEGKNEGIKAAINRNVKYIYTLDNDLIIEPNTISTLVSLMEANEDIGCAGSIIYYYDKRDLIFNAGSYINWTQNLVKTRGLNEKDVGQLAECAAVDYVGAGAMLTRRYIFEHIGLLDPIFIGYGCEDSDFGMRVNRSGFKVVCFTRSRVWHKPFSTIGGYSYKKKYLESRNAIYFLKRYGNWNNWAKFILFAVCGLCFALVREGLRGNLMGVVGKARGLYDGLRGREALARELLRKVA